MKICAKCKIEKQLSDFYIRNDRHTHYSLCKKCWYEKNTVWRKANPEKHRKNRLDWITRDPENARAVAREMTRRRRLNPKEKLISNFRMAIYIALKGLRKRKSTFDILGYSREQLVSHLEKQFISGMSWENYGDWHIDHIIPLSQFCFYTANDEAFKHAWHLSNLRPLWAKDNIHKKNHRTHLL